MSFSGINTTEAIIVGLGCNLHCFEAKRKGYNVEEGHSVQFVVQLGQKFSTLNQNRKNRLTNRILVKHP